MIFKHFGIVSLALCAAVPVALFLAPTPAVAKKKVKSIEVGPIWNQADAEKKCPKAARKAGGTWNGQWRTTRPGQMSECDIKLESQSGFNVKTGGSHKGKSVEVGPIWNQFDAQRKCPEAAKKAGGTWTGEWRTTRPGQMSECDIKMGQASWNKPSGGGHHGKSVEVGPIWNQMDAERKCPEAARKAGGTWTGEWRTTRPGQMSECDIKR